MRCLQLVCRNGRVVRSHWQWSFRDATNGSTTILCTQNRSCAPLRMQISRRALKGALGIRALPAALRHSLRCSNINHHIIINAPTAQHLSSQCVAQLSAEQITKMYIKCAAANVSITGMCMAKSCQVVHSRRRITRHFGNTQDDMAVLLLGCLGGLSCDLRLDLQQVR